MKEETRKVLLDIRNGPARFPFSRLNKSEPFRRACRAIEKATRLSIGHNDICFGTTPLRFDQLETLESKLQENPNWIHDEEYPVNIVGHLEYIANFDSASSMSWYSSKSRSVELFWLPTIIATRKLKCRVEDLSFVLLLLGAAHALIHYGTCADGRRWKNNEHYADAKGAQREWIACLARYWTHRVLFLSSTTMDWRLMDTFLRLIKLQPPEYQGHLAWISEEESARYVVHGLLAEELFVKEQPSDLTPSSARTDVNFRPLHSVAERVRTEMLRTRESDTTPPSVKEFTERLQINDVFMGQALDLF